jgi:hypothetical protein
LFKLDEFKNKYFLPQNVCKFSALQTPAHAESTVQISKEQRVQPTNIPFLGGVAAILA